MSETLGILGVGQLAGFVAAGLHRANAPYDLVLSPRNGDKASALARDYGAKVCRSNQEVVDQCDMVFVCLPAAQGCDLLASLKFRPGQRVLSAMAGTSAAQLADCVGPAQAWVTMMPGAANALGMGPCLLFPQSRKWAELLTHLGPVVALETAEQFDVAAVFGGFSGASFVWLNAIVEWFEAQGLSRDVAQNLVAATLRGNAEVVLQPGASLAKISQGVATPGGVTQQMAEHLEQSNGLDTWRSALDAVLARIRVQ